MSEKVIQQRTGHCSIEALRQYKRTSESQLVEISNLISDERPTEQPTEQQDDLIVVSSNTAVSEEYPQQSIPTAPTIVLKGCSFTGCSIAFSGNAMNNVKSTSAEDVLQYNDIFIE